MRLSCEGGECDGSWTWAAGFFLVRGWGLDNLAGPWMALSILLHTAEALQPCFRAVYVYGFRVL